MPSSTRDKILQVVSLVLVLLAGAFFRYTGLTWGDYEYQHPDERFLIWVVADIAPVENAGDYFNTAQSSLNPANRGHAFYVYGDLPVIATRYLTEAVTSQVGWDQILEVGRGLSAAFDLLTVLLVYLIALRLSNWKAATLAGLFTGAAVLQIQQAHFFTTDSFSTTFTTLAIYLAVVLVTESDGMAKRDEWLTVAGFGAAVGLAMACKLNTFVVAGLLPAALALRAVRLRSKELVRGLATAVLLAVVGGAVAFLAFRLAQPYAFSGPGFFNIVPDQAWMTSIMEQRAQAAGDVDFPPSLQWARRSHLFSLQNLFLWGLGAPLALLSLAGFFYLAWQAVDQVRRTGWQSLAQPRWSATLLVWLWTMVYFTWQSMAWNPTMRYQLPVYPTLAILAAEGLGHAWKQAARLAPRRPRRLRIELGVAGAMVLLLTLAWAFAFTRIYTRTETRVAASNWIFENVPGPVNLVIDTAEEDLTRQLLPVPERAAVRTGMPYYTAFDSQVSGLLQAAILPSTQVASSAGMMNLRASVLDGEAGTVVAVGEVQVPDGTYENTEVPLAGGVALEPGRRYVLALEAVAASAPADGVGEGFASMQLSGQLNLRLYDQALEAKITYSTGEISTFELDQAGTLRLLRLSGGGGPETLNLLANDPQTGEQLLAQASRVQDNLYQVTNPLAFKAGVTYLAAVTPGSPAETLEPGQAVDLVFLDGQSTILLPGLTTLARADTPLYLQFTPHSSGSLRGLYLGHAAQVDPAAGSIMLSVSLAKQSNPGERLAEGQLTIDPAESDPRGKEYTLVFDTPVRLEAGQLYTLILAPAEGGTVAIRGSAPANESAWDMGLPFRTGGYDPYGGIYRGDLSFEMYWDDNADKYQRFVNILDQADTIFLSSNRQWGTTTRIPERHPLTTEFYRALLGCPVEKDVIWCYNVAEKGTFQGELGYDLVETFTSYPNLGPIQVNTQFAEEAFTVYDHPKVMVFKKRADYDSAQARAVLGKVDLSLVVRVSPKQAAGYKNMLLPEKIWSVQQVGGTWASLFPPEGLQNRYPWLGLVYWYVFLWLLGVAVYPLLRLALPGLADKGYPLARIGGLVLLAYPAWLLGSLGVPVTRVTLLVIFLVLAGAGAGLAAARRGEFAREWRQNRGYFLRVELIALALFTLSLLIRLGNPDLWHPIYGGEKPMDFSQFNAVLKSTLFPAYDSWFAGGSMNYYYYGYVLVGMPVKLLGITPSVAYNLVLPALFSMVGLAAFSIAWNLVAAASRERAQDAAPGAPRRSLGRLYSAGIFAILALLLLGNLGTPRMLWEGLQKLVVSDDQIRAGNLFEHWAWAAQGLGKLVSGEADRLPYYPGDWYWKPSRAIQPEAGNEITEFPFFTFLYADLHAHLMALPVTLLGIAWALSALLARGAWSGPGWKGWAGFLPALALGGLIYGALRPTNTWDQYTYLALGSVALAYGQWQSVHSQNEQNARFRAALRVLLPVLALVGLSLLLYRPFDWYFGQGYNELTAYEGQKTGISSYLVHWGLFLFVIAAWLAAEAVDWMAETPLSHLNRLRRFRGYILAGLAALALALIFLLLRGVAIALIAGPLGLLAALLLLRPGQPLAKRGALFLIGTALALTLAVELVAVKGDIARMNTVFKFYYQAWSMLSISAAAALAWLLARPAARTTLRWNVYYGGLIALVFGAALYPVTATRAKITDRMTPTAPRTLDGMDYMAFSTYGDGPTDETYREMDLTEDYYAIRWVQQNIPGSPVIVEANTPEYRHWGSRFTIYTGLPGVVGWNWHERQQRALTPDTWVWDRINAIPAFYQTTSPDQARAFLDKYDVGVIVVGQLERIYYAGPGLEKFPRLEGVLWEKVYEDGQTVIYTVIR